MDGGVCADASACFVVADPGPVFGAASSLREAPLDKPRCCKLLLGWPIAILRFNGRVNVAVANRARRHCTQMGGPCASERGARTAAHWANNERLELLLRCDRPRGLRTRGPGMRVGCWLRGQLCGVKEVEVAMLSVRWGDL